MNKEKEAKKARRAYRARFGSMPRAIKLKDISLYGRTRTIRGQEMLTFTVEELSMAWGYSGTAIRNWVKTSKIPSPLPTMVPHNSRYPVYSEKQATEMAKVLNEHFQDRAYLGGGVLYQKLNAVM